MISIYLVLEYTILSNLDSIYRVSIESNNYLKLDYITDIWTYDTTIKRIQIFNFLINIMNVFTNCAKFDPLDFNLRMFIPEG